MSDIKIGGHYYKKFKIQGIRKITVVDIADNGMVKFVFGHRSPGEAFFYNKMECFAENVIEDIPEDLKMELDRIDEEKRREREEAERLQKAEEEEKAELAQWFVDEMRERGIEINEVTASWMTKEQMEQAIKDADMEKPEEGFMLF